MSVCKTKEQKTYHFYPKQTQVVISSNLMALLILRKCGVGRSKPDK